MARIVMDLGDRDTKRWHTAISCLVYELKDLKDGKVDKILNKFDVTLGAEGMTGVGLLFPADYRVPQELI